MGEGRSFDSQSAESQPTGEASWLVGLVRFFRRHPVLVLVMLSPGIPEYLSGSSNMSFLALNPVVFFLFLALNMGLYSTGVLLIREAVARWDKGWASVLMLGFAYAIVEEGLALQTLFNPNVPPVTYLAGYGRWLGINWVFTIGIVLFHSAFSIALPLFLFRMAFPEARTRSLLSNRRAILCLAILGIDCLILFGIVSYWPGVELMVLSGLVTAGFVWAARVVPADWLKLGLGGSRRLLTLGFLGGMFFPAILFTGAIGAGANLHPVVVGLLQILFAFLVLRSVLACLGSPANSERKITLAIGLIVPVAVFGIIASLATIPVIIMADLALAFFIRQLWKKHHATIGPSFKPALPRTGF